MSPTHLTNYTLHLADNALILGHRNSEWCGHGPVLEQDIAITNIALDHIGQARNFYQYAAQLINATNSDSGEIASEDTLVYLRDIRDFKNCLLVELPKGDWGQTILRQFFFSAYQYFLYEQLQFSKDETLAAISAKALKEVTYHLRWSSEWVIRLGDGTEESHQRMLNAIDELWMYTGEMFEPSAYEKETAAVGIGIDGSLLKEPWTKKVKEVFDEATLPLSIDAWMQTGGKAGNHTEHLGYVLAELQFVQRAYPGNEW